MQKKDSDSGEVRETSNRSQPFTSRSKMCSPPTKSFWCINSSPDFNLSKEMIDERDLHERERKKFHDDFWGQCND